MGDSDSGRRILVAGGTGVLGRAIVERLAAAGQQVRVLTRDPERARQRAGPASVEFVPGDLRDPGSLDAACEGATHVITTANAFIGRGAESVTAIDRAGNRHLVDAARAAGVRQFVFTSALLPEAYRSVDYFAAKFDTEDYLRASGLTWTILRPTAFMDTWAEIIGGPLVRTGATTIFGSGDTPTNFVAAENVADVAVLTLDNPRALNTAVEVIGPENLTLNQVADVFERVTGRKGKRKQLPVFVLRASAILARPFNPVFARQAKAGALMAVTPTSLDPAAMLAAYPIRLIRLEDWVRRRYDSGVAT